MLPMGFAIVLSSGPNPEIMLAIDFRCRFYAAKNHSTISKALTSAFCFMFFCLDAKESKNQGCEKIG